MIQPNNVRSAYARTYERTKGEQITYTYAYKAGVRTYVD
jgi:hypothetical protein